MTSEVAETFAALIDVARAKGVKSARIAHDVLGEFTFELGEPPTKLESLRATVAAKPDAATELELRAEERRVRLDQAREDMREQLAANGKTYTDEQIDMMLPPEVLR